MQKPTTLEELEGIYERHSKRAEKLKEELGKEAAILDACRVMISTIEEENGPNRTSVPNTGGLHSHIRSSQIGHCKNQIEGWETIANLSGGLVRPSEGAQLLIDAKLSNAQRRSLVSTATNFMINSAEWDRVKSGTYKWLKFDFERKEVSEEAGPQDHDPIHFEEVKAEINRQAEDTDSSTAIRSLNEPEMA